jgi:hypothetical protein
MRRQCLAKGTGFLSSLLERRAATRRFEPRREQTALAWLSTLARKTGWPSRFSRSSPIRRSMNLTARSSIDCRIVIPTHRARLMYIAMKRPRSDSKVFRLPFEGCLHSVV